MSGMWKKAEISHDFVIEEIVVSDELKACGDYAKIKENALRKGRVVRRVKVDEGDGGVKEREFEA